MKIKALYFIGILLIIYACNQNDDIKTIIEGNYVGIFERNANTSNVELNFHSGTYSGKSQIEKFPAICDGTYSISENIITFKSECIWTAEFDWSLILAEKWTYTHTNDTLIMINSNGDQYRIIKQ